MIRSASREQKTCDHQPREHSKHEAIPISDSRALEAMPARALNPGEASAEGLQAEALQYARAFLLRLDLEQRDTDTGAKHGGRRACRAGQLGLLDGLNAAREFACGYVDGLVDVGHFDLTV